MSIKITINADELAKQFKEFAQEAKADIERGVAVLAAATQAKVKDMAASDKLASTADIFDKNLRYEEVAPGIHVISILDKEDGVDGGALWIEEGLPPNFDMKPGLLSGKSAKTGKKGKFAVVPFDHTKPPSRSTAQAQEIVGRLREALGQENRNRRREGKEPLGTHKIEYQPGPERIPKFGKLHTFNWGGNIPGKGNTGDLQRVVIYQTPDKSKAKGVRRDIFTFRTVSSGPASAGKWMHPGMEGKKYLDKAAEWAMNKWETDIFPQISKKWDVE